MLAAAGVTQAGVSGTVTVASDYDFRGISLTSKNPTIQASVDYAHDSGFYAGIWGSNVDFGNCCDENIEIDYYLGYGWGAEDGPAWNAYFVYYTDPGAEIPGSPGLGGTSLDYPEINFGVTYKWFNAKLWYSWDYNNTDKSGYYIDTSGTFEIKKDSGYGLVVHAGYSTGPYWKDSDSEYFDYSIGVTKSFGNFNLALKFIDGSDLNDLDDFDKPPTPGLDHDIFSTDPKVLLSVATTFPWASK
jgi:uncharacterized protein (TIGR02001 family)